MTEHAQYTPGPARGAQVRREEAERWTLILVRDLRHSPEKVWQALTDPAHVREWAPFVADGSLAKVGNEVILTWVGSPAPQKATVTRADAPEVLEYGDIRWELQILGGGTRLTLWHKIDRRFIAWGAAGWHISFDILDHFLDGHPIGRLAGPDAMKSSGWQRLVGEYAKQFAAETPNAAPDS
jgi:hypothetical protein